MLHRTNFAGPISGASSAMSAPGCSIPPQSCRQAPLISSESHQMWPSYG